MRWTCGLGGLLMAAFLAATAVPTSAAVLQYDYTGSYYDQFDNSPRYTNPYNSNTRVTGYFQIDTALIGADVDPAFDVFFGPPSLLTSYYFTDGVTTISSADPSQGTLGIGVLLFNLNGSIAAYSISGETPGYPNSYPYSTFSIEGSSPDPNTALDSGEDDSGTSFLYDSSPLGVGAQVPAPGNWSGPIAVSAVPELSTWSALILGLFSIGAARRGHRGSKVALRQR